MPVPPIVPTDYDDVLASLKSTVRAAQIRARRSVNTELLVLYWDIGATILERQSSQAWGSKVLTRLSEDLRAAFPGMRGLGRSNLEYMRRFAAAWPREAIPQQSVGELPWGHVTLLLDRVRDPSHRDWYAAQARDHGWTRAVLQHQIDTRLHERIGTAPTNFSRVLDADDSTRSQLLARDPYVFDFLELGEDAAERDIEQALMNQLQSTLMELGRGFAFVGRQVHFNVAGDDFYADLVFFHMEQLRYVVIELKVGPFKPDYVGQLGFYVALIDDQLRKPELHAPTIGLLLCASRNDAVVRYALANTTAPMAVANYTTRPTEAAQMHLPTADELEQLVDRTLEAEAHPEL